MVVVVRDQWGPRDCEKEIAGVPPSSMESLCEKGYFVVVGERRLLEVEEVLVLVSWGQGRLIAVQADGCAGSLQMKHRH